METNTATTPTTPKAARKVERTALKSICAKLGMDPKAARRKLRKSAGLSFHGSRERWTFTEAQAEKVREILKESDIERAKRPARKSAPKDATVQ